MGLHAIWNWLVARQITTVLATTATPVATLHGSSSSTKANTQSSSTAIPPTSSSTSLLPGVTPGTTSSTKSPVSIKQAGSAASRITKITSGNTVVYKTKIETHYITQPASHGRHDKADGSGLSSGAIAGIAVGAIGAIALFAALVFYLLRRRRRSKAGAFSNPDLGENHDEAARHEKNDKDMAELHDKPVLFEARGGERYELPNPAAELEGDEEFRDHGRLKKMQDVEPKSLKVTAPNVVNTGT